MYFITLENGQGSKDRSSPQNLVYFMTLDNGQGPKTYQSKLSLQTVEGYKPLGIKTKERWNRTDPMELHW